MRFYTLLGWMMTFYLGIGQNVDFISESVTQDRIESHITFIASDELQGRKTGAVGNELAALYIQTQLMSYGVQPAPSAESYRQKLPLSKRFPTDSGKIKIGEIEYSYPRDFVILSGSNVDSSHNFVFVDFNKNLDLENTDVRGKVVIGYCGNGSSNKVQTWFNQSKEKITALVDNGAIGLVELYQSSQVPYKFLKNQFTKTQFSLQKESEIDFLHIWFNAASINKNDLTSINQEIQIELSTPESLKMESANVIGLVEGKHPTLKSEYIVLSAHFDHVGTGKPNNKGDSIYNGARDNAVGVTGLLEAGRHFSRFPPNRSLLFVFFTGEEQGLLGSKYFIDNCPIPLNSIKFNLNIDNGGYNDTSVATIVGLERTSAQQDILEACNYYGLEGIDDPAGEQGLFDRSDNVNFAKKGIPAPTFSMGFRSFNEEIFKYYHQVIDEAESLDYEYLLKYFRSYVRTVQNIANNSSHPKWNKNDKYYPISQTLYGTMD